MPILLPVLVRRSVRDTTVAATRPAVAPAFTERRELGPRLHLAASCSSGGVFVERMAGQEEADGVVFALQLVGRQPGLDRGHGDGLAVRQAPPNMSFCPTATASWVRCAVDEHGVDGGVRARAVRLERVERAGRGEAFQHALVDRARIDAAGEIGEVGERLVAARRDDAVDRLPADALERGERVVDGVALDLEARRPSG